MSAFNKFTSRKDLRSLIIIRTSLHNTGQVAHTPNTSVWYLGKREIFKPIYNHLLFLYHHHIKSPPGREGKLRMSPSDQSSITIPSYLPISSKSITSLLQSNPTLPDPSQTRTLFPISMSKLNIPVYVMVETIIQENLRANYKGNF